ncbi:hypothetical protein, variant 2 [Plasmopara halstedii]|uniref:Myb-like domain-containing protein n=1 Tax=Plasmopara halstedii TaxID=4781 RepID=A0A0N7L8H4_PLAHL|nr:hypothetical protein, variant 2 [Plasmopara halstedii]CEG49883.1 hypothetical protein, variant 2 [Plasmopara halstedii]|eukprot:XP_024586252.1 hypothetical protein, variant 2 [Plasmopara halstedii]
MSDVAQILGLAGPQSSANAAVANDLDQLKPSGASPMVRGKLVDGNGKQKKLTGMQREVLELLESSHRANHALYQGFGKTSLKQKWQEKKNSPAVKWIRKSFRNPARAGLAGEGEDKGLTLSHWGKAHVEQPDYVFARFNVKSETTSYTEKEYEAVLAHHDDPKMQWSKEEMDLLMNLCQRYDLRWVVILDKYNANPISKGSARCVEDVKYCYYETTRLLAAYRADNEKNKQNAAAAGDCTNTNSMNTPAVTEAEVGVGASTSSVSALAVSEGYKFNIDYEKQRKKQLDLIFSRTSEEENELQRLNDELRSVEQQLKKVSVRVDPKKKKELADVPYEIKRTLPTGVILRSSLLALPQQKHAMSAKLIKKLQLLLDEMGVPVRPMPTQTVCETFDKLRQDAVGLLSLRKHLKSKQTEVRTLSERYRALTGKEYKPITTPITISDHPGNAAISDGSNSATITAISHTGKSSKHSEKVIRAAKRRSSSGHPGLPAKRNKKGLH